MPGSLLCCYCCRPRGLRSLRSYDTDVLIVDRVILTGFRVCPRHPVLTPRYCGRCSWRHFTGGTDFWDEQGKRVRECPRCESRLGYEEAPLSLSGKPLVRVVRSEGRARVRYEGRPRPGWVAFPRELRHVGALYEVDQIEPVRGGYYRAVGEITRVGEVL